jgi:signal transduction histidine kinase
VRRPAFLDEPGLPANRPKIWMSIRSGYATAAGFAVLALAGWHFHLVGAAGPIASLVLLKLTTNTLALIALRRDRFVLDAGTINVATDIVCMTGAIYYTGGTESPLFSIYLIEITVVALLTNLGTTVLVAAGIVAMYATMAGLVHAGVLRTWATPLEIAGGRTTPYVVISVAYATFVLAVPTLYTARILTLLHEKERALEKHAADLVEAGRQKSQFMANVTHELRTPIQGICGLSDLVETGIYGPVSERQREAHQGIKRSAKALLSLIDDLLELARSDAGKARYQPTEVDVGELLASVIASAKWMVGTKNLSLELDADELPTIFTDRAKLNQVLLNLLANAVKFTPSGGVVTLRARAVGDRVELTVSDTGIGIPEKELPRIFDEFRQVDGTHERAYGGVGLGLALVKRLADLLGADVTVSSEPGRGSVFCVTIPVRHAVAAAA